MSDAKTSKSKTKEAAAPATNQTSEQVSAQGNPAQEGRTEQTPGNPPAPSAPPADPQGKTQQEKKTAASVAPGTAEPLHDVDALIKAAKLKPWQGAALCRQENWAPGKQISQSDFDAALARLENRRMGG